MGPLAPPWLPYPNRLLAEFWNGVKFGSSWIEFSEIDFSPEIIAIEVAEFSNSRATITNRIIFPIV